MRRPLSPLNVGFLPGLVSLIVATMLLVGCGGDGSGPSKPTGQAAAPCGSGPLFTVPPIRLADIGNIAVVGGLGAPRHTLPTAHTGFILATEGASVSAPGTIQVLSVRRVRSTPLGGGTQGEDYAVDFQVCREIAGHFGHLTSLSPALQVPESSWKNCRQYTITVPMETIETCDAPLTNVTLQPGQAMGTGGASIALGRMGLDFGLEDTRVNHYYAARWRHPPGTFHSVCPWEAFEPGLRDQLYAKLRDLSRPPATPAGEPRCGTLAVDVATTAQGVWALPSETQPLAGDETGYITLANYPYRPQDNLALSLGPTSLGAGVYVVGRQSSGRVNRAFDQVTNDGLIYCYGPDNLLPTRSWLLTLTSPAALRIRMVDHAAGAGTCAGDPATWSMAGAVNMVR